MMVYSSRQTYDHQPVIPILQVMMTVLLLWVLCISPLQSQVFTLNGSASLTGGSTFRLTPDSTHVTGAIWSLNRLDLMQPFDFSFKAYFGSKDASGGHGLAFVLQKTSQQVLGEAGNGMGFKGISPSAAFVFDTYEDPILGDPYLDHVTFHTNGIVTHGPSAPTVQANPSSINIEDGQWHTIRIRWNPVGHIFQVFFNGVLRITVSNDLVNNIFGGNNLIWWGITAATGAASNIHEVQFHQALPPAVGTPLRICAGDTVHVVTPPGSNYSWTPATGISNTSLRDPMLFPSANVSYTLTYTDTLGSVSLLPVQVNVNPLPIPYLLYVPGGDSTYCKGGPGVDISLYNSQTSVQYDLLLNGGIYWPDVQGNGSGISFGYQQPSGVYTCTGIDTLTACAAQMLGSVTVIIDSLPIVFNVTGTGAYCQGGAGQELGLDGSETGVQYTLIRSPNFTITTLPGNGSTISFGYQQAAGNYVVRAINPLTGCTRWMNGTASVSILPLPSVSLSSFAAACAGSPPMALSGGIPLGGTYSGTGIFNDTLYGTGLPGTLQVTYSYTDPLNGCTNVASAPLTLFTLPHPQLGLDTFFCAGDSILLHPNQTFSSYAWSEGSSTSNIVVNSAGLYMLTVTDHNGCSGADTIMVLMESLPVVHFSPPGPYCEDTPAQNLTGGTPAGGIYGGFGITGGIIDPATLGPGYHTIHYTYVDPSTSCINSDTSQVMVHALPLVQHTNLPSLCLSDPPFNLTGGQPSGGVYSGAGVTAGYFDPAAGAGTYPITYSYTNPSTGCDNSTPISITVHPLPVIQIPAFPIVCDGDQGVALPQASPQGGSYSGIGVTGSNFTPINGPGPYLLRYHYTDPITQCTDSAAAILQVRPRPQLTLSVPTPICESNIVINLSGGQPAGGTYSGIFVAGGQFSPLMAGSYPITYAYQDPLTTCQASVTETILVNPLPNVTFVAPNALCESSPAIQLTGGSPGGGSYTGNGVTGGTFDPGIGPGTYPLTYHYQDSQTTCGDSAASFITVYALPLISHPTLPDFCMNDLPAILPGGSPLGGWYSGVGVSGNVFHTITAGSYTLYYHVQDTFTLCEDSVMLIINVYDLPILSFPSPAPRCASDPVFSLGGGLPAGGTYGGTGVTSGQFDPGIGAGAYPIWYAYEDPITSCHDTIFDTLVILPLPAVSLTAPGPFCLSSPDTVLLSGLPSGGTYGGTGMLIDTFSPVLAGIGNHQVFYSFMDTLTGCSATDYAQITVYPLPSMSLSPLPSSCVNDPPLTLSGGSPPGGTWQGNGVMGGLFDPSSSGSGSFVLTYSYSDPFTGCIDSLSETLNVWPLPQVSLVIDTALCESPLPLLLSGGSPAGGTYGGAGVAGNQFTSTSGAGDYIINYVFEDPLTSCRDTALDTLMVYPVPLVTFSSPPDLCLGNAPVALSSGLPAGGTYTGTGVVNNTFDPSVGPGTFLLTYTFRDPSSLCTASASDSITVFPLPLISIPILGPFCENDSAIILPQGIPAGGTWGGSGVFGLSFDPSAGSGNHLIWYTWQDSLSGCADTVFQTITVHEMPQVEFISPGPFCFGEPPVILNSGSPTGGSYAGSGVTGSLFDPSAAVGAFAITYTFQSSQTGCIASVMDSIHVFALPQVSTGPDIYQCEDTLPYTLPQATPSGGYWTGPHVSAGTFNPPIPGQYELIYFYLDNITTCSASDTMQFSIMALPDPNIPSLITLCQEESFLIQAQPGYAAYEWSDGSMAPYLWITQPGIYWLQVTDLNLCKSIPDTIIAVVHPLPDPGLPSNMSGCRNAPLVLEGSPGMDSYTWQDGSSGIEYLAYAPGTYWLEVVDQNGCVARDSVSVTFLPSPEVRFPVPIYLCDRSFIILDASQEDPGCTYYWNDGDTSPIREISVPGEYSVTVTNGQCQGWGYTIINPCAEIWAPNAFTPNGDRINDAFRVFSSEPLLSGRILIFDRWGVVVFASNNPTEVWDGSHKGIPCPQDVYTWVLDFVRDGLVPIEKEGRRVGQVILIR